MAPGACSQRRWSCPQQQCQSHLLPAEDMTDTGAESDCSDIDHTTPVARAAVIATVCVAFSRSICDLFTGFVVVMAAQAAKSRNNETLYACQS